MSNRAVHIHTRESAALQWGHRKVPAKFNFASDVVGHWAGMEKIMGWRRGTELDGLAVFINHPFIQ